MVDPISTIVNMTAEEPLHPYYPLGVALPGYAINSMTPLFMVTWFCIGWAVILSTTALYVQRTRPGFSNGEKATVMWFVLCGFVHLFFEGYFSINSLNMPGKLDLFGQLWKEYSLSDSRYLTRDPFLVCMETVTAFCWGPLSFLCAYFILNDHPLRHPLQLIISLGQLYGDVLYLSTCEFSTAVFKEVYCRPERIYYWAYYALFNGFWIVFPLKLIQLSVVETGRAFRIAKLAEKAGKKNI